MSNATVVSPKAYTEALEEVERLKRKYTKVEAVAEEKAGYLITGATIVVTEGALGYSRGRWGEKKIGPFCAEIWAGGAAELLAIWGVAGKWSELVANVGHASLGFATGMEMLKVGEEHRVQADKEKGKGKTVVEGKGETVEERRPAQSPAREEERQPAQSPPALPGERRTIVESARSRMADDVAEQPVRKTGT